MALNHYSQEEHRHRFLARQYCCSTGSTLFRSCQRCWGVYAHGGEVWGLTGHHPAAFSGSESLFSGRASALVSGQTVLFQQRKHSVQNLPAMLGGVSSWWGGLGTYGGSFNRIGRRCVAYSATPERPRMHRNGGGQAGRCGPTWRWMASSCCVGSLGRSVRVSRRSKRHVDARRMQRTHELRRSRTRDGQGREGTAEGRGWMGFI